MTNPKTINNFFLVRSEHLNHHGNLFGGNIMAEMDTVGYCLLRQAYPKASFVTRASRFTFDSPAGIGDIVRFDAYIRAVGTTSVTVEVTGCIGERLVSSAETVYVNIGPEGKKARVPLDAQSPRV